jgi:uncharacterized protein (DUF1778 family)
MSAVYLNHAERELLDAAARVSNPALPAFIRQAALSAARRRIPTPPQQETRHD